MSGTSPRRVASILIPVGIGALLFFIKWVAEPAPSAGKPPATVKDRTATQLQAASPPKVSIVFVIDSSYNMRPTLGQDYFELAKEGIVEFLSLHGFPMDGSYEVAVIQYAKEGSPGYDKGEPGQTGRWHWFAPFRVNDGERHPSGPRTTWEQLVGLVAGLEPTRHFTGSLLESGLNEARRLIQSESAGDASTDYHVILLGTGEYRLPLPCPPAGYCVSAEEIPSSCPGVACEAGEFVFRTGWPAQCNRACQVRHYVSHLRNLSVRISAVHLGPSWKNRFDTSSEKEDPYDADDPEDHTCDDEFYPGEHDYRPPFEQAAAQFQPDREGFFKELAYWVDDRGPAAAPGERIGGYVRIHPDQQWGCELNGCECAPPGTARDIAKTVAGWMCEFADPGVADEFNDDLDFFGPAAESLNGKAILDICDNCWRWFNPRQRDCDDDGIGDVCQVGPQCDPSDPDDDADCDAIADGDDQCQGGDDCLVRHWAKPPECVPGLGGDPCGCHLGQCGCDCDNNGQNDLCQAAQDYAADTLGPYDAFDVTNPTDYGGVDADFSGLPDCAEDPALTCTPIPAECDLRASMQSGVDHDKAVYVEDFVPDPDPPEALSWLTGRGWRSSTSGAMGVVGIVPTAFEWPMHSSQTSEFPVVGLSGYLDMDVDPGPVGTDPTWYLESPQFVFPAATKCKRSKRQQGSGECVDHLLPLVDEWPFVAVDLELNVSNDGGDTWRVALLETCGDAMPDRIKTDLVLMDLGGSGPGAQGTIQIKSGSEEYAASGLQYFQGVWFRLTILLDNTARFTVIDNVCVLAEDAAPITLWKGSCTSAGVTCSDTFTPSFAESTLPGIGDLRVSTTYGLRVRLEGSAEAGTLRLGALRIRPTNGCELGGFNAHALNGDCPNGGVCNSGGSSGPGWECTAQPGCNTLSPAWPPVGP